MIFFKEEVPPGSRTPPPPSSKSPEKNFSSAFGATVLCVSWTIFDEKFSEPKTVGLQLARRRVTPLDPLACNPPPPPSSAQMCPCTPPSKLQGLGNDCIAAAKSDAKGQKQHL